MSDKQKNHASELEWILGRIRLCDGVQVERDGYGRVVTQPRIYMLEQVIEGKDYCAGDVHAWGEEAGCKGLYGKIRDILRMRMITENSIDKAVKLKHLAAFDGYVDKVESKVSGNLVVNILKEGAEL